MSRYTVAPRCAPEGDFHDPLLPGLTVDDHKPVDTGLVSASGGRIMRLPEPMGFHAAKGRRP